MTQEPFKDAVIKMREQQYLPCPVCGQRSKAEVVLRHVENSTSRNVTAFESKIQGSDTRPSSSAPVEFVSEHRRFNKWFSWKYADPDGKFSHVPGWLKNDLRNAWLASAHESLTRPSSSAPVERREAVATWEIIDKGGRNPLIIIKPDQVRLWLRSIADAAGYADRTLSASQVTMDAGSSEETIALGLPQITLMVSNIPNSRASTDAILSLPGSSSDEVLEDSLSEDHVAELEALAQTTAAIKGPSFIHRMNWPEYSILVQRSLVTWGPPPGDFSDDFASVELTSMGRAYLAARIVKSGVAKP